MVFLKKIIFFLFLIAIIYASYVLLFYKDYESTYIYKLYYEKKSNYAKQYNSPRIFFSAGSNVRFGVKTERIEKELDIPTINMALAIGFEPDYMFHMLKNVIKKDDIVIIPMEYQNILLEEYSDTSRKKYILTYDQKYLWSLSIYDILDTIFSITPEDLFRSLKDHFFLNNSIYQEQLEYINSNGDQINNVGKILNDTGKRFKLNTKPFEKYLGIQEIIKFNRYCKKNGIKFFMTFPNIMSTRKLYSDKYIKFYNDLMNFYELKGIKYIDTPTGAIFDPKLFYDSVYHMNQKGMDIRTDKLIKIINEEIIKK